MKDLPHHMKKLNRRVIRSMHREEMLEEVLPELPAWETTKKQLRKKTKNTVREERHAHRPSDLTADEKNKKMKKRVPIFDRNDAAPKGTRSSKKKTPRI